EVSCVLNGLVHLLDEVRSNRNVVVLDEDPVALLGENVGDLLRDSGHRATTAQEEVVLLTGTAWHCRDPRAQQQWSRASAGPSRTSGSRGSKKREINFETLSALAPAWLGSQFTSSLFGEALNYGFLRLLWLRLRHDARCLLTRGAGVLNTALACRVLHCWV